MKVLSFLLTILFLLVFTSFSIQAQKGKLSQADALYTALDYNASLKVYQKEFEKRENETALFGVVRSLFELGNMYKFNDNLKESSLRYSQALEKAKELVALNESDAEFRLMRGLMYLYNGDAENARLDCEYVNQKYPDNGRAYYYLWLLDPAQGLQKAEHAYVTKAFDRSPDLFEFHQELGSHYASLNMANEAISHYEKAIEISPNNYKANFALGQVYWALGNLEKMRFHFGQSLMFFPDFGYAKMLLAGVELMSDDFNASIPLIQDALKDNPATEQYLPMFKKNFPALNNYNFKGTDQNEHPVDADGYPTYYQEALALAQAFSFDHALDKFHQCNDTYRTYEKADPSWQVSILSWMTHCYREVGEYAKAIQTGKQSLEIAVANNLATDQASLTANIGVIYNSWGDYPNAIVFARKSLTYLAKYKQTDKYYDAYINLGVYYRTWGESDSAVYYHKKAVSEALVKEKYQMAVAKKELALSYCSSGLYDSAKMLIDEVVVLKENHDMKSQVSVLDFGAAQVYYDLGEYEQAFTYIQSASAYYVQLQETVPGHPSLIPFIETFIGIIENLEMLDLAYAYYTTMNDNLINQINKYFPAMNENGKLLFYREVKQYFESFNSFAINETVRPNLVFERMYENQLMIKGLLFNSAVKMQRMVANSIDEEVKFQFANLLEKKNLLARSVVLSDEEKASRGIDLVSVQHEIDSLEVELTAFGVDINSAKTYEKNLTQKVRGQLKPNEAAIEVIRYRTYDFRKGGAFTEEVHYVALVLRGDSDEITYVLLEDGNNMEQRGYQAYVNAIIYELEDVKSYEVFWSAIQKKLEGIERVYFAGDGIYHKININTLYNPKTQQYVIDDLDVRLLTSTRDLLKEISPLPKKGTISLIGSPSFELSKASTTGIHEIDQSRDADSRAFASLEYLAPLPGTFSEVKTIESLLKKSKWKTSVMTGDDALEENIKQLNNPTVLHIATHGYFEESMPKDNPLLYSGLLLSGASSNYKQKIQAGEDGILTAYEAMHLNLLQTQMVVLSACETGMGRIENGEGVYGLQRAFLIAGAQSVIMSMWKVNDQTTMELMSLFYSKIEKAKEKHQAFRGAQLELKEKHPNPKYWGAFSIIGK